MGEATIYEVTAEVCRRGENYGRKMSRRTTAHSENQAVLQVAKKLEDELGYEVFLKDYLVRKIFATPNYRRAIPIKNGVSLVRQFELDYKLEREEGCSDLGQIRHLIYAAARRGHILALRPLAEEGNWEKAAEIIAADPTYTTEHPLPLLPLFESCGIN